MAIFHVYMPIDFVLAPNVSNLSHLRTEHLSALMKAIFIGCDNLLDKNDYSFTEPKLREQKVLHTNMTKSDSFLGKFNINATA